MWKPVLLLCVAVVLSVPVPDDSSPDDGDTCGYDSCKDADPSMLNIHIVPHTHDDVGWLKTVDQYYYGSRNNIQKAGVQYILDSVIKELWEDPKRRFIYVETAFFWKWWTGQSEKVRDRVHTLVRQGRLQMVGGAWSMNDEASSHYQSTIDQFTWGLSKLNQTFGPCGRPHVGWQIDPFGHSREFASLLAAMGYDGLFLGRIDYQDKVYRLLGKRMEMLWRGDDNLGKASDIFTGVLYNTYSPPPGFCFDVLCNDEPIIDDPSSPMFNVDVKVERFLAICQNMSGGYLTKNILVTMGEDFNYQIAGMWFKNLDKLIHFLDKIREMSGAYTTNNILVTMGDDFQYQNAAMWYINLDKLIKYTNLKAAKDGLNVKAFYSTPDCYLKAVKTAYPSLPTKQDDFFPYASDPTAFWTGYFTSRPTTKYFEREANAFLQMIKNLQVTVDLAKHNQFVVDELKSAMGVMQHHDAITGTEKQHVTYDYERLLTSAIDDAMLIPNQAFNKVLKDHRYPTLPQLQYQRCRLNESSCSVSEEKKVFVVTVYNGLAWSVREPIRIPVLEGRYTIRTINATEVPYQIIDIPESVRNIPTRTSKATHELVYLASLPPLGFQSYYITKNEAKVKRNVETSQDHRNDYYTNLNDYWTNIRIAPYVDSKNIEDGEVDGEEVPDLVKCNNLEQVQAKDLDLEVLKDKNNEVSDDILQLEKIIREAKRNMVKEPRVGQRENMAKKMNYPRLNDEEMRMLADEPVVVNKFEDTFIENEYMKVRVDNNLGIVQLIQKNSTFNLAIKMYYWPACFGDNTNALARSSGAYIFRPNATTPHELPATNTETKKGDIVSEIRVTYTDNSSSTVRLYRGLNYLEHEFVVGPIPVEDKIGKEYVVRYESSVKNNGVFYTDSNGRQVLKRKLNQRPQWNLTLAEPIPGNYYPVTNKIYIDDGETRLSVITDRAQGGTSLNEGDIELMLHRRLLHDDAFGVDEALNESVNGKGLVVRGVHRILTKDSSESTLIADRKRVLEFHNRPVVFIADAEHVDPKVWIKQKSVFQGMEATPNGIHLLTLEPWSKDTLLLRLENYLDKSPNSTIEVDLSKLLKYIQVKSYRETTLAANQWLEDYQRWNWKTDNDFFDNFNEAYGSNGTKAKNAVESADDGFKVQIRAGQIRTFIVEYIYDHVFPVNDRIKTANLNINSVIIQ